MEDVKKEKNSFRRFICLAIILSTVLLISATVSVTLGSVSITPSIVWKVILTKFILFSDVFTRDWSTAQETIIWQIRAPRVILSIVIGAGLAISGAAIQALVRNSIADPYILGVSSGASVGATSVLVLGAFSFLGTYALTFSAFIGALISVLFVFFLSRVKGRISVIRLLLAGIAISFVLSAITNFILLMSKDNGSIKAVMHWMMGSLAGAKWEQLSIPFFVFMISFLFLWSQYRHLNILLLGEESAITLGVNIERFRIALIVVVSLLTGVLVSVSGSIGFIGLIIPHVVRLFIGSNYKYVIPISALLGAVFLVWADAVARVIIAPEEMPIGIITALCGGPFFIWLLRRNSYSFGEGE